MLGLKMATDPRWVNLVEGNIQEILTDHAYCEQKAVSNAIYIIVNFPEYTDMVQEMIRIAEEELLHFKQVHDKIVERGWALGRERKDPYVNELMKFLQKGGSRNTMMTERLLFSAMVEARSCERFKLLSERVADAELKEFYRELMISEATHYTTFIGFAKKYADPGIDIDNRWKEFLEYESQIIQNYGVNETMHG